MIVYIIKTDTGLDARYTFDGTTLEIVLPGTEIRKDEPCLKIKYADIIADSLFVFNNDGLAKGPQEQTLELITKLYSNIKGSKKIHIYGISFGAGIGCQLISYINKVFPDKIVLFEFYGGAASISIPRATKISLNTNIFGHWYFHKRDPIPFITGIMYQKIGNPVEVKTKEKKFYPFYFDFDLVSGVHSQYKKPPF